MAVEVPLLAEYSLSAPVHAMALWGQGPAGIIILIASRSKWSVAKPHCFPAILVDCAGGWPGSPLESLQKLPPSLSGKFSADRLNELASPLHPMFFWPFFLFSLHSVETVTTMRAWAVQCDFFLLIRLWVPEHTYFELVRGPGAVFLPRKIGVRISRR